LSLGPVSEIRLREFIPAAVRKAISRRTVRFRCWGRLSPFSRRFGYDRGLPIDRYYIENFLNDAAPAIRGHVLEIGGNEYTKRFGGGRVTTSDVLHVEPGPGVTIVADLQAAPNINSSTFDCIICTQTLQFIFDTASTIQTLHRILKPGGTVLVTTAGIAQIARPDAARFGEYWRFTGQALQRLFECTFSPADVRIETYGNVLAATAFLYGLSVEDLRPDELSFRDPDYEVTVALRARRSL
jgi:SAM-dependent methyltransferase